jgi:hypothetical protein
MSWRNWRGRRGDLRADAALGERARAEVGEEVRDDLRVSVPR